MMSKTLVLVIAFVIVLMSSMAAQTRADHVIGGLRREEKAAACVATELMSCLQAILKGSKPPEYCCEKLKEQQSCLCGYIKTPTFGQYVTSENAHKLLAACGIPYPKC